MIVDVLKLPLPFKQVSYVLDLREVKGLGSEEADRVWGAHGWLELPCGKELRKRNRQREKLGMPPEDVGRPGVRPHLARHEGIEATGLGSLKEALRLLSEHYPEFLHKVRL